MNIMGLQWDLAWEDRAANYRVAERLLSQARPAADTLVVLPEMFPTGFSMNPQAVSEEPQGSTWDFLRRIAMEYSCTVLGGLAARDERGELGNEAVVIDARGLELARYRKMHPFSLAGEKLHFAAGGRIVSFPWGGFRVAPFICYDLRFPEIFRLAARRGADFFIVIASWPETRIAHWRLLLQARAVENQAYVMGVNRRGRDPHAVYCGSSMLVDPSGAILADAGDAGDILHAEVDADRPKQYRAQLPFLNDMRSDLVPAAE
jgi:predicted amidohydrolase